jgi:glycosyltransferase involved in cell wall biosynthesis
MKVLIDGRILGPKITGVERYIIELINQLAKSDDREEMDCAVLLQDAASKSGLLLPSIDSDPRLTHLADYDLYHRPFQVSDRWSIREMAAARVSVLTVHDLIEYHYHDYWENEERFQFYRHCFGQVLAITDRVICVSEATKKDLLNSFPLQDERVAVVYHGINARFKVLDDPAENASFRARYGLPEGYLLTIGTSYPHKNRLALLLAFERLLVDEPDACLVLVGGQSRLTRLDEDELIRRLSPNVINLGAFPDEDIVQLYNSARIFIYPSLYEGFGMPILEAFACGVPVVSSNLSSLPEVTGDSALLVDPTNPEDLTAAIRSLYRDVERQREWRAKGLRRVEQFSWARAARETMQAYLDAAQDAQKLDRSPVRSIIPTPVPSQGPSPPNPAQEPPRSSFTLAICTRNRAGRLATTLESLSRLNREGIDFCELMVVDNGSTDQTRAVVEAASTTTGIPIRYLVEGEAGLARARNLAIAEARGEIIIFLDDDIEAPADFLAEYAHAYERWPDAWCIGGKVELKWLRPRPRWMSDELSALLGKTTCPDVERQYRSPIYYIIGCNMSFRRDIFSQVGTFDPELGYQGKQLRGNEENELLRRIDTAGGTIIYSPFPRLHHLIDDAKLSRRYFLRRYYYQGVSDQIVESGNGIPHGEAIKQSKWQWRTAIIRTIIHLVVRRTCMNELVYVFYHWGKLKRLRQRVDRETAHADSALPLAKTNGHVRPGGKVPMKFRQDDARTPEELCETAANEELRAIIKDLAGELMAKESLIRRWPFVRVCYRFVEYLNSIK